MTDVPGSNKWLSDVNFGVGTWAWGDRLVWGYGSGYSAEDVRQAFDASIAAGVTLFDTAEVYGQGRSEQLLGQFIKDSAYALADATAGEAVGEAVGEASGQRVLVATKFMPFPWRLRKQALLRALRGSLRRLGLEQVDLYQIHQALPPVNVETWMDAMAEAVQAGLTRSVGVSNYNRSLMQRAYDALAREGIPLASNQVEYSLINRKVEKNGLLKQCQDTGVRLIAYSPLGMGLLTGKYSVENPPAGIRAGRYNKKFLERMTPLLTLMKRIGQEHDGKTPAQVALNWTICKGTLPIPGAKTVSQAEQNAGALGWRLTDDEVAALDAASDPLNEE